MLPVSEPPPSTCQESAPVSLDGSGTPLTDRAAEVSTAATVETVRNSNSYSGLTMLSGKPMKFCGGSPASWRDPTTPRGLTNYLQVRSFESTKYQDRLEAGVTPTLSKSSFLTGEGEVALFEVWVQDVAVALEARGLDTMFWFPRGITGVYYPTVLGSFSIDEVRKFERQHKREEFDKVLLSMNWTYARNFLRNSIDAAFWSDIVLRLQPSDGPVTILALIYQTHLKQ